MTDQKNPYITNERWTHQQARASQGCWLDSHRGQYIGEAVIAAAVTFGFEADEEQSSVDCEHYHEEWERAENYLNANIVPEGYNFSSNDNGDWGLWQNEETEEQPDWLPGETLEERNIRFNGPRCDQCAAARINGVFCHEHGCPNQNKLWDIIDQTWKNEEPDEEPELADFDARLDDYEFDLGE